MRSSTSHTGAGTLAMDGTLLSGSQGVTLGRQQGLSGPEFPLLQKRDMIHKWAESLAERCYRWYRELSCPGPGPKHTATWRAIPSKDPGSGTQAKNRLYVFSELQVHCYTFTFVNGTRCKRS